MSNRRRTVLYTGVTSDLIRRETQIKGEPRRNKVALVEGLNARWRDLWKEIASPLRGSP